MKARIPACLLALCLLRTAFAMEPNPEVEAFYKSDAFFPIFTFAFGDRSPAGFYKDMKDCGFTIGPFVPHMQGSDHMTALDLSYKAGLKALVQGRGFVSHMDFTQLTPELAREKFDTLADELDSHPGVYGYYIADEPAAKNFVGLGMVVNAIRGRAPDKFPFINLVPNHAGESHMETKVYREFLERFVRETDPAILCFDYYPIKERTDTIADGYWQNLTDVRDVARESGKPFWVYVACAGLLGNKPPTRADISFQVYAAIAFGAKGIGYFIYTAPPWGNYRGAPRDQFGVKTPTWYDVQYVNKTLAKYAPLINHLRSEKVYHFEGDGASINPPPDDRLLKNISEKEVLVAEFTHDQTGDTYVMLLNKNRFQSRQYWKVEWAQPAKEVVAISPWGPQRAFAGENLWLAPGMPVFLKVTFE